MMTEFTGAPRRSQAGRASIQTPSQDVAGRWDAQRMLERALDDCLKLTRSELGYVDLLHADGHRQLAAVRGAEMGGALMRRFASLAVHAHIAAEVMIERQVKISNDAVDEVPDGHPDVVRFMGAPLARDDVVLGMVAVANKGRGYTSADARRLSILAQQIAVAIGCARLYERQRELNDELQRRSSESSDRAASDERQRLARELHDSASQALYGIALAAQAARRAAESEAGMDRLIEPLDFILQLAEVALAEMRALIFDLRPESLAEEGLIAGLQRLTAAVAARHRLDVRLAAEEEPDLDAQTREAFYRIAHEAMHNAVKHASARSIGVRLVTDRRSVELQIIDDGVGFEPQVSYPGHMGLDGMKERARASDLQLTVDSRPGAGVEVKLRTRTLPRRSTRVLPWS
jgi:signal transduction histidine kinase